MNATVRDLLNCHVMREIQCVTENYGWNKVLTWCVEVRDEYQFAGLNGGELVVIPENYMKMTSGNIENLFKVLYEYNVSGVMFEVNNAFSGNLLANLVKHSEKKDVAVFSISREKDVFTYIKEINKEICYLENRVLMEESLLTDFLFKDRRKLICAMERLENCGIDSLSSFEIAVVKIICEACQNSSRDYNYRLLKNELIRNYDKQVLTTVWDDAMIVAFQTEDTGAISDEVVNVLESSIENILAEGRKGTVRITVGRGCQPISAIRSSFDEALFTMDMYDLIDLGEETVVRTYDQVGLYRILRNSHDPEEFSLFYREHLGELEEYDRQNNSELVETLKVFIDHNCSLLQTANVMYLHKNTLRYRIQRIEELTGCDLKDMKVISDFYLCFRIRDYMGIAIHS